MEKTYEFIVDELGEVSIVVRPMLPFMAEGYRLRGDRVEIFGDGRKVSVPIQENAMEAMRDVDEILLCEFLQEGSHSERELHLSSSEG